MMQQLFETYLHKTGSVQEQAARQLLVSDGAAAFLCAQMDNPQHLRGALALLYRGSKSQAFHQQMMQHIDVSQLAGLLQHADAKVRKNAATLIGSCNERTLVPALIDALQNETQRFNLPSIVLALGALGGSGARDALLQYPPPTGDDKHDRALQDALQKALSRLNPSQLREFTGFVQPMDVLLAPVSGLSASLHQEARRHGIVLKQAGSYAHAHTANFASLFELRCFYEALLPLGSCAVNPEILVEHVQQWRLYERLSAMHAGSGPFALRLELRSKQTAIDRGAFASSFFAALDSSQFTNAPSSYDIELRAVEQNGKLVCVYKLHTYHDARFDYRLSSVPASIHPAAAAATLQLVAARMQRDARILDPFCGSGTMLIERAKLCGYRMLEGVDINRKATDIATANGRAADVQLHAYHRDIVGFVAKHPYQEIISNMPFGNRVGNHDSNVKLYQNFFTQLPQMLAQDGFALLITNEKQLLKDCIAANSTLRLISETPFSSGGLSPSAFVVELG
ncbi:methyltransferase [Eubacteriales bacterium OttesenSCG-928-N14]|nr:methyltransferase [Eubacteriales bacterium OttesenSCG-928-N14]